MAISELASISHGVGALRPIRLDADRSPAKDDWPYQLYLAISGLAPTFYEVGAMRSLCLDSGRSHAAIDDRCYRWSVFAPCAGANVALP